jgi:glyoxylase-like metal-dependent hydrolase (beta-lactamase superfamily II)
MKLEKINGNTYYINAPTNIGVYTFKNKNCILIDTGSSNSQGRKIDLTLVENKLHPKYIINTHNHLDHCGGNNYFTDKYPGCLVYTSEQEKVFMEYPEMYQAILYSTIPTINMEKGNKGLKVDFTLDYGTNKINEEKFEVLELKGHSIENIGIITPDKVCFLGDSIFSDKIMEKYGLPNLLNLQASLDSLNIMKDLNADFYVLSHSDSVLMKSEFNELIDRNIENINKYIGQILVLLETPATREELLENLVLLNEFTLNFHQYNLYFSSLSSFLIYLSSKDEIKYSQENGKIYYYSK